jgi:putative transposase
LTWREGKKIAIVKLSKNKQMVAKCIGVDNKNIYQKCVMDAKDQKVKKEIENTFLTNPAYGHRRLAIELRMNHKKILRVMHKYGLKPPRLWYQKKFTTQSNPAYQVNYTNLLKSINKTTLQIGAVWSCDLTYIKYQGKFIYLSIIQDIVSKEVVGFNLSFSHDASLVLKTIKEAVLKTGRFPNIFHCDRGRENLSQTVTKYLEDNGAKVSVSDPGSPWQNAWSESFFSRLKGESGPLMRFESLGELIEYIFGYLNYYNSIRIHTKLKMSPYQFRLKISESVLEKWGT